ADDRVRRVGLRGGRGRGAARHRERGPGTGDAQAQPAHHALGVGGDGDAGGPDHRRPDLPPGGRRGIPADRQRQQPDPRAGGGGPGVHGGRRTGPRRTGHRRGGRVRHPQRRDPAARRPARPAGGYAATGSSVAACFFACWALTFCAYTSTYSRPDSSISSYMISSVTARSMNRSPAIPAYREKSIGAPNRIRTRLIFGSSRPIGWTSSEFSMTTGITGAPLSSASRATPVLPRYRRPSGDRVPSG